MTMCGQNLPDQAVSVVRLLAKADGDDGLLDSLPGRVGERIYLSRGE